MSTRFVILHHKTDGCEHWDLLIEHGDVLLAWQLLHEPIHASGLPIPATRIADHRKLYLEYEGPISRSRGHVCRVDSGTAEIQEFTAWRCRVTLRGDRVCGDFVLERLGEDWSFSAHKLRE